MEIEKISLTFLAFTALLYIFAHIFFYFLIIYEYCKDPNDMRIFNCNKIKLTSIAALYTIYLFEKLKNKWRCRTKNE